MRIGYCRVSSGSDQQAISLEAQQRQFEAAGCDQVLAEQASAYREGVRRPAWERLLSLVASGEATEVMVIDQSRLSRQGEDLRFLKLCAVRGVRVMDVHGTAIEVASYGGFVSAGVQSVINEANSMLASIKVRNGIARRKQQGYMGTGRCPFGYRIINGIAEPNPETWAAARAQFDGLMAMGMNITQYLRRSGSHWSTNGLRKWVKNPMLRGYAQGRWGAVEPLISAAEYEQALLLMPKGGARTGVQRVQQQRLLSRLVRCSGCGRNLAYRPDRGNWYLRCVRPDCRFFSRGIQAAKVRQQCCLALTQLAEQMADEANQGDQQQASPEEQQLVADLQALKALAHLPLVREQMAALEQRLAHLREAPSASWCADRQALVRLFGDAEVLQRASDDELRPLLLTYIAEILYVGNPTAVEVRLQGQFTAGDRP